ncbi:MAG: sigma-54-dependent Fis family transcriptional regulator [Ignavibacteria bacterium GWB2_35_6b]|nr:MAG: sigma-54-dependent Fis family transcriptional regulator [Ignavibacteria bacterium GWB2_35_6b]
MTQDITTKQEILDSIAEGLFTIDKEFRINFINSAAEKITGFKKEEVIGQLCRKVFRCEVNEIECPIAKVLESDKNIFELKSKIKGKNNSEIPIKLNAAVLKNKNSEPVGGVISFRDISYDLDIESYLSKHTNFYGIVGHSKIMTDIFYLIQEIADTDVNILITGETGTGKEMIADAIQKTSRRKDKKFLKVNCGVLPPNLLASELFGHVKGAFTDAVKDRIGRFELCDGGTIFLDEITEMTLQMQTQLLRVIQNGTFEKVGDSESRKVDVRVIAATNANLNESIKEGKFREDLFYRLNVVPIELPPLRKRKEDIPFLGMHFIKKFNLIYKKNITEIEPEALNLLTNYNWPGNIRELENAIEYAFIRTKDKDSLCACSLPLTIRENINCLNSHTNKAAFQKDTVQLVKLLEENNWNKSKVAKLIGVNRTTVWRQLKNMGFSLFFILINIAAVFC